MALTNLSIASKYAMNIADDSPIAIYDILPDATAMQVPGGGDAYYENQEWPDPPHPTLLDEPNRWSWFRIPSGHTAHNSNAYYLRSRYNGESEWPVVSGLPMLYGGLHRARYALLNRDVSVSEPPLPFLQVPSFGIGQTYADRAKTLEWWMETDPYPHPVNMNMFDDQTAIYSSEMAEGTHYSLTGTGFVLNPAVTKPNDDCGVISLDDTTITFIKDQPVVAAKKIYTFSITAKNFSVDPRADLTVSIKLTQARISEPDLVKTYTDTFQVYDTDDWITFNFEFVPSESMTFPTIEVSLYADKSMYLTEMGLWAGQGGQWMPPGVDSNSDIEFFTTARPTEILSIGGVAGDAVTLSADDGYMYLRSVDSIDSYYVGEWGRQMYMCLVDEGETFSLYMNTERIMSVNKKNTATTGVAGEYAIFYISPLFKYIDMSTIAVYTAQLSEDIMRLHYIFGGGPKYADVMNRMPYQDTFVADGSAVDFSGHALFPQSHSFNRGTSYGVDVTGNTLSLPDYPLPRLDNAEYSDIQFELSDAGEYSLLYFKIPENARMEWAPRVDIGDDVRYVFIDVASLLSNNVPGQEKQKICRVESGNTPFVLDFFIEIDLLTDGEFEDSDFTRDFSTTEKSGSVYAKMYENEEEAALDLGTEVFRKNIIQSDFSLVFNIDKLMNHDQYPIAVMFSDPNFKIIFDNQVDLKSFSCSTPENLRANNILFEGEDDLDAIQIDSRYDDFGTDTRNVLQNATYSVYPNVSVIDGNDVIFLDRAANGYWKVNIPLVNLAAFLNGKPDLDFIMYADSDRLPQIVSGLNTNRLTYSEVQTYILQRTQAMANAGTYAAAQTLFDGTQYGAVGVDVTNVIPTLGRFANPSVQTFVTLDSQSRFPFKDYSRLSKVKATTNMFVEFENTAADVRTSKWEIFNNFAIRVPRNITLSKYELGYAVHLRSASLTLQRPVVRSADFFGVSSGNSVINAVTTGTGSRIYVGNENSYGVKTPYSIHIPTETFPSMYMPKSFGFYPHSQLSSQNDGNIVYQFIRTQGIKTVSFYMLWRGETFPVDAAVYPGLIDNVGFFNYTDDLDATQTRALQVQSAAGVVKLTANLLFDNPGPTIYVDGVEDGLLWVNKWHLVQINFDDVQSGMTYSHANTKAVTNFVTASSDTIDVDQLYASRTGRPNITYVDDDNTLVLPEAKGYVLTLPFNSAYKKSEFTFGL